MPESDRRIGAGGWRRRWRSRRFRVSDASMQPTLLPGDRLLVDPAPLRSGPPPVGTIVVLTDPEEPSRWLVKRVVAVDPVLGQVTVRGDDPAQSRDSRAFGPVPSGSILGIAWFRYLPGARRGPLAGDAASAIPKP